MATGRMYDVPATREPFALRGARDVAVVLDAFTPTNLDAWTGRALLPVSAVPGPPPPGVSGEVAVRCVVVRHAGDVRGRAGWGARGRRVHRVYESAPGDAPLLGVVVEERGASLVWLPPGDPAKHARDLSRRDWRAFG